MGIFDAVTAASMATAYDTVNGMTSFPVQLKVHMKEFGKTAPGVVIKVMHAIEALNKEDGMADVQHGINPSNRNPESSKVMQEVQEQIADGAKGTPVTPGIIQFQTLNGNALSVKDFPKTKELFDEVFCMKADSKGYLWFRWVVISPIVFQDIRKAANSIISSFKGVTFTLQPNFSRPDEEYLPLGFFANIHACTTNRTVFHQELLGDIESHYESSRVALPSLPEMYCAPDFYVTPSFAAGKGKVHGVMRDTKADALVLYVAKTNKVQAMVMFTKVYSKQLDPNGVFFVPFHMKHEQPDQFAAMVALQNTFNDNHRSIQLAGISPDMMDHLLDLHPEDLAVSMWDVIRGTSDILHLNPTPHVHTEGK